MKTILLLAGLCALVLAVPPSPAPMKGVPKKYHITEKPLLEKHIQILDLLKEINHPEPSKYFQDLAHKYNPDNYGALGKQYWEEFLHIHEHDAVHQDELFAITYPKHLKHAIALFKVFYNLEWEFVPTLYAYAKQFPVYPVNTRLLTYSFLVGIIHRGDFPPVILPALYELIPDYFYNAHVHHEAAHHYKSGDVITANYTHNHVYLDHEQHLAYFTEDIGLNSFYAYYHLFYPFWMNFKEYHPDSDHKGELYYFVHQQLWARYHMERLSHDYTAMKPMTFNTHFGPYHSELVYSEGYAFPSRPEGSPANWEYQHSYFNYTNVYVQAGLKRLYDAIQTGFAYNKNGEKVPLYGEHGMELFGEILEGSLPQFRHYYGSLQMYVRHILGYGDYPLYNVPSVVEQFSTALRDPAYWQYVKYIVDIFQIYKENNPHRFYTEKELIFPGVKVESVQVDRLTTYFDWFYSDLSLSNWTDPLEHPDPIKVRQLRLSHKPFTYTINVESSKPHPAVVRVFLGPKYDEYGNEYTKEFINQNRLNFYLVDKFYYHLEAGKNSILRNSKQTISVSDKTSFWQLYQRFSDAYKGNKDFIIDGSESSWGMPNRLILPIGKPGGMKFQFYVVVSQYPWTEERAEKIPQEHYYSKVGTGSPWEWFDEKPFGYPLDKPIDPSVFFVDNSYFQDVVIYHKEFDKLNVPED